MPVLRVCSSHSLVRGAAQKFLILIALLLTDRFGSAGILAAAETGMQLLPNGMALILIPNSTPTVSVRLLVPAGGRDDPRGLEGLAHYVEHLIASDPGALGGGAADRGAPRLRAHGPANAFTSLNRTVYLMEVSPNALEDALDLLAKRVAVLDASAAVALREQNVVRQEYFWRYGKTQRLQLHSQLSMRLGLTDPALGWNIGTPDTIARFSLEPARAFWQQHYAPQAMTLVISGAFDRAAAEELTLSTLGAIPAASIPSTDKPSVTATAGGTTAVTLSLSDAQITDPAVQYLAYFDLSTLDDAARMRRLAATCALRPILAGGHHSVKGVSRTVLDTDTDARVVDIGLWLRDKRWLELGVYIEASTSVARKRILGAVLSKLASLKADNTPAKLLEDCRREGNGTWRMAADAPDADAVVQWLSLGFSLEQRAGYRAALRALTADDVFGLIRQVARPTVTAKGEINPAKE